MPQYFFNIHDSRDIPDDQGTHLSSPEEACTEAVAAAGAMLKDLREEFWCAAEWRMHVTDEQGATVCALTIRGTTGET
jgi:hypothetical protein